MKVVVGGGANLYLRDGAFQLYAQTMANAGLGRLYEQFEALKTKLAAEGLFDAAHKKPLPRFPRRIGVVTSPTGAVIRDIIHVSTRRNPGVDLLLVPCRVQGDGAAEEMISALETLWQTEGVDVILIGRGGGSLEDLWEFNRENLARAIYRSPVPVVSCVGHETDTTIADYVSDLRAPTPSAAAELAVPLVESWQQTVDAWMDGMAKQIHRTIERTETRLALYTRSGPMVQFPMKISQYEEKTAQWQKQTKAQALQAIEKTEQRLLALKTELYALSPQHALKQGYAILRDETGALISSVALAEPGAVFTAYLADGTRRAAWQTEEE